MKILISIFLPLLSLPIFSRIWGHISRFRYPRFLVKRVIRHYQRVYKINMDEYQGKTEDYKSLSDFFTRELNPIKRPLQTNENAIVSPADGFLTNIETTFNDRVIQVKGKTYSLSELIGEEIDFSQGWNVATIYLSPSNYHRYHYPLSGKLNRYLWAGARLFPVNQIGVNQVERLFVRNERIVTEIENQQKRCYIIAVGATFVGSIVMEFLPRKNRKKRHQWHQLNQEVTQLDEMGRFEMGSTIILVIPKNMAEEINVRGNGDVRVGDPLFILK